VRNAVRLLLFISLILYVSSLVTALGEVVGCSSLVCGIYALMATAAATVLGLIAAGVYALYACPLFLPAMMAGVVFAAKGYGIELVLVLPLASVLVGLLLKRDSPGVCLRGIVAGVAAVALFFALSPRMELLAELVGRGDIAAVFQGIVEELIAVFLSAARAVGVGREQMGLLYPPSLGFGLGLALFAVSVPAGLLLLAATFTPLLLASRASAPHTLLAAVETIDAVSGLMAALIVLVSANEESSGTLIVPQRPTGRTERLNKQTANATRQSGRATSTRIRFQAALSVESTSRNGVNNNCRNRRLREFVALVSRTQSQQWKAFFDSCLRGRSIYGYRIEALLGVGADGVVFRARDEDTGAPAALKMILPEPVRVGDKDSRRTVTKAVQLIESLEREGASLRELSAKSPYIVRVKAIHTDAEKFKLAIRRDSFDIYIRNPPSIIMEYMAGGSIEKLIDMSQPGDKEWIKVVSSIIAATAAALRVVHENGYVHSDVKPANVLLSRPLPSDLGQAASLLAQALRVPEKASTVPKLSDLGVASRRGEPVKGFTPLYAAPEVLLYEATCLSRSLPLDSTLCSRPLLAQPHQDIYSLGVIALQLFTGAKRKLLASYIQLVRDNPRTLHKLLEGKAPRQLVDFIARMLSSDPSRRPAAAEVEEVFRRYAFTA